MVGPRADPTRPSVPTYPEVAPSGRLANRGSDAAHRSRRQATHLADRPVRPLRAPNQELSGGFPAVVQREWQTVGDVSADGFHESVLSIPIEPYRRDLGLT
jgi:hypothetical protein